MLFTTYTGVSIREEAEQTIQNYAPVIERYKCEHRFEVCNMNVVTNPILSILKVTKKPPAGNILKV